MGRELKILYGKRWALEEGKILYEKKARWGKKVRYGTGRDENREESKQSGRWL